MRETERPFVYWIASIIGMLCLLFGSFIGEGQMERKAIRAGVAYYTNDASGTVEFKWKEAKP